MRFFVALTDYDWFRLHASKFGVEEVNFWRPSPEATFKAHTVGEPFLFKLHAPRNFIVGGGFFTKFLRLPISLAWEAFGEANGARSLEEVRERIGQYRRAEVGFAEDPNIGCILLAEPFFFPEPEWIPAGPYFPAHTQVGKGYGMDEEPGRFLWQEVAERLQRIRITAPDPGPAIVAAVEGARFGKPVLVNPRLGQGSFRVLVTDAYSRRCAMTQEKTLPVLEAAHIRPYSRGGAHELSNGLCLRSDLHRLFDKGYMTVDPNDKRILVSRRIKEEFDNGEEYYDLHGKEILLPSNKIAVPSSEHLRFHAEHIFK
jgi:putative restriction endonuclease